jgi:ribosomal protein L40E
MRCAKCGAENPDRAKFCVECASPFARRCLSCNAENPPTAKFCLECAKPLEPSVGKSPRAAAPASWPLPITAEAADTLEGERKTVTALFADIKGSMELIENLDPEEARSIVDPALKLMIAAVHHYEGYVAQITGDGTSPCSVRQSLTKTIRSARYTLPSECKTRYAASPNGCGQKRG